MRQLALAQLLKLAHHEMHHMIRHVRVRQLDDHTNASTVTCLAGFTVHGMHSESRDLPRARKRLAYRLILDVATSKTSVQHHDVDCASMQLFVLHAHFALLDMCQLYKVSHVSAEHTRLSSPNRSVHHLILKNESTVGE